MRPSNRPVADPETFKARAVEIAQAYRDSLPPDYAKYSLLADVDTVDMLCRATRSGLKPVAVCEAAGIHPTTLQRWLTLADETPNGPHAAFASLLKALRRQGQLARLEKIEAHGDREWTALAWLNERTDQEQFALQKDKESGGTTIIIGVDAAAVARVRASVQAPQLPPAIDVTAVDVGST